MTDRIHTCSYYCHHAACIKAQRDELRDKYVETKNTHRVVSVDDLKALEDKLDFWINRADTRSMSEQEYKTWLALGHQSKTARRLRAIIEDKP